MFLVPVTLFPSADHGRVGRHHLTPAMHLLDRRGVALPVISIITIAHPAPITATLSAAPESPSGSLSRSWPTGSSAPFYALPRTGTSLRRLSPCHRHEAQSVIFNLIWDRLYLCWNPTNTSTARKVPTPILPTCLFCWYSARRRCRPARRAHRRVRSQPATPVYLRADDGPIAALAFGIIVDLARAYGGIGAKVVHRTSIAAVIAGAPWASSTSAWASSRTPVLLMDGAILADAAQSTMGVRG